MHILKREVIAPKSIRSYYIVLGSMFGLAMSLFLVMVGGLTANELAGSPIGVGQGAAAPASDASAMPEGLVTVVITPTTEGPATCKEIMELYEQLPTEDLLDRPGLLDQVGDCTLKTLEPACETLDITCHLAHVWHRIVD